MKPFLFFAMLLLSSFIYSQEIPSRKVNGIAVKVSPGEEAAAYRAAATAIDDQGLALASSDPVLFSMVSDWSTPTGFPARTFRVFVTLKGDEMHIRGEAEANRQKMPVNATWKREWSQLEAIAESIGSDRSYLNR